MNQLIDDYIRGADLESKHIAAAMDACILLTERGGARYKKLREEVLKRNIPCGSFWKRVGTNICKKAGDHYFNPYSAKAKEMYEAGPEPQQTDMFEEDKKVAAQELELYLEVIYSELQERFEA